MSGADANVYAYADITVPYGVHPDCSTECATYPPGEWEDAGAWEPYAVVRIEEENDYGRRLRAVDNRCWRRLLRRVAP